MASVDVADRIAAEIVQWLDTRSSQVASAILESAYRPRVVEPTTAKAVSYYRSILVNPDNTLNEQGKQQVIQQNGASAYTGIARAVARQITTEQEQTVEEARAPGSQVDRFGPDVPTLQGRSPTTAPAPQEGY